MTFRLPVMARLICAITGEKVLLQGLHQPELQKAGKSFRARLVKQRRRSRDKLC